MGLPRFGGGGVARRSGSCLGWALVLAAACVTITASTVAAEPPVAAQCRSWLLPYDSTPRACVVVNGELWVGFAGYDGAYTGIAAYRGDGELLAAIPTTSRVAGLVYSEAADALLASLESGSVLRIDAATRQPSGSCETGRVLSGMCSVGGRVYGCAWERSELSQVDAVELKIGNAVPLSAHGMRALAVADRLYVAVGGEDGAAGLDILDLVEGHRLATVPVPGMLARALDWDGEQFIYIAADSDAILVRYDLQRHALDPGFNVRVDQATDLVVDPGRGRVYVAAATMQSLMVISTGDGEVLARYGAVGGYLAPERRADRSVTNLWATNWAIDSLICLNPAQLP